MLEFVKAPKRLKGQSILHAARTLCSGLHLTSLPASKAASVYWLAADSTALLLALDRSSRPLCLHLVVAIAQTTQNGERAIHPSNNPAVPDSILLLSLERQEALAADVRVDPLS